MHSKLAPMPMDRQLPSCLMMTGLLMGELTFIKSWLFTLGRRLTFSKSMVTMIGLYIERFIVNLY